MTLGARAKRAGYAASEEELPGWARRMLRESRVAHLGLVDDDGHPRVLPVTFALHGGALWSAVDQKPKRSGGSELARVRYLRSRPQAALTVDHYEEDWSALGWVQALGRVRVVPVEAEPAAVAALVATYDQYREQLPPGPLICLMPERFIWWSATE